MSNILYKRVKGADWIFSDENPFLEVDLGENLRFKAFLGGSRWFGDFDEKSSDYDWYIELPKSKKTELFSKLGDNCSLCYYYNYGNPSNSDYGSKNQQNRESDQFIQKTFINHLRKPYSHVFLTAQFHLVKSIERQIMAFDIAMSLGYFGERKYMRKLHRTWDEIWNLIKNTDQLEKQCIEHWKRQGIEV